MAPKHARHVPKVPESYGGERPRRATTLHRLPRMNGEVVPETRARQVTVSDDAKGDARARGAWVGPEPLRRATPSVPYDESAMVGARSRVMLPRWRSSVGVAPAAIKAVAVVLRVAAALLCVLVLANAAAIGIMRLAVVEATMWVTNALPPAVAGVCTMPTILGGTFRGDIAASAIALFVVDWACMRLAMTWEEGEGHVRQP